MRFNHFFWDFDGTLYNTYPMVAEDFTKALRDTGLSAPQNGLLKLLKTTLGNAARTLGGSEEKGEEIMQRYNAHADSRDSTTLPLYPLAGDALRAIWERGGKNYLYTHRNLSSIEALRKDGLWPYFSDSVTSLDGFAHKPSPDALNHLLNKHGLPRQDCCMVGDRSIDLNAGRNAGIAPVLFDPDGFYRDYDTPYRFKTYSDFIRWLDEA